MKLLDILVRDLKVWPEGAVIAVQDFDGEVKFYGAGDLPDLKYFCVWVRDYRCSGFESIYTETAEDFNAAIIYHEEWEMARSQASHQDGWNGEGMPPVDTELELNVYGTWERAKVIAHDDGKVIFRFRGNEYGCAEPDAFRPLESSRIKAERAEAVERMLEYYLTSSNAREFAESLYDAGFRKQEVSK